MTNRSLRFLGRADRTRGLVDWILAIWFLVITTSFLIAPALRQDAVRYGWDAVVYAHAARELLSGGDPWSASVYGVQYAAPPISLVPYLPFALLPDVVVAALWFAIAATCSIYALRTLRLPLWWLLFPPVAVGIAAGSSAPLVLALLVRGGAVADATAILARVYAGLPLLLLGRWRGIALAGLLTLLSIPFLAWATFLERWPEISRLLAIQASGGLSATVSPLLVVIAVVSLVILGRRKAAWLIVPALWPNTQLYYGSIALPVIAEVPLVALALASPAAPGIVAIGLAGQAAIALVTRRVVPRRAQGEAPAL